MVPTETPLTTMDNIAQALAFTFDEEFSNLSDASVNNYQDYQHQHQYHQVSAFTSHSDVVDVLVQGQGEVEGDTSRYSLHSLRRGAVTGAVNNGCDDHTVRKQMRLASVATVQRYASMDNERLKCATNKLFKK